MKDHPPWRHSPRRLFRPTANDAEPWNLARLLTRPAADPELRLLWLGALLCLGLFALLFCDSLDHFYYAWTTDENYSHGFLVPLISLYFAEPGGAPRPVADPGGCLARRFDAALRPGGAAGDDRRCRSRSSAALAFLVGLAGIFTLLYGTTALRRYWFAFFFLVFMVPLPVDALFEDRLAAPAPGQPGGLDGDECHGRARALRGEPDDAARRRPDVRRRGVQRDEAVDRIPGADHGRRLLWSRGLVVPRGDRLLRAADRPDAPTSPG